MNRTEWMNMRWVSRLSMCSPWVDVWMSTVFCYLFFFFIIIIIYPLTAKVIEVPLIISQPVSSIFLCSPLPSWTWWTPACSCPDVVFPPLPLSALSSSPFQYALQDGFCQSWWMRDMNIPLQFASLYNGQEVFMWPECLLGLGMDFLYGNTVFAWDA